jgi:iron-sulfur cluster repair protein YtfE (RIC family)
MTATTDGREAIWAFVEHEHRELTAGIDHIHELTGTLATVPADRKSASVGKVLEWIEDTLVPHMAWEETWLCPQIEDQQESHWVTRLVRFDHQQISRQANRVKAHQPHLDHGPSSETVTELLGDLFALEALLRAHLEREEHFLVPLLEGVGHLRTG